MTKIRKYHSLRSIIKNSFFRLTAMISITFAIVSISLILFTEHKLFIPHLQHEFKLLIQINSLREDSFINKYEDSIFYRVDDRHMDILPYYLKGLDVGHHEVFHNGKAFHVLVKEDARYRYLFEINQSDFERMEQAIILIVIIAMLFSWGVALIAGRILAKKIIDPIQVLSERIKNIDKEAENKILKDGYSNDEIGQLSSLFDEYNQKINEFLKREKLFTSDVSHELRTPLMIISSSCELLLIQHEKNSPEYRHLLKIKSASDEIKELLSIFLALSRNADIESKPVHVASVIKTQYEKFISPAEKKGLILEVVINDQPEQKYSEEYLSIIIRNLLANAINYTESGYIKVELDSNAFSVCDSGPGIPEDIKSKVFDPFVGSQNSLFDGMGLGLSIVQRICEKKGWKIHLQSKKKEGTCIKIIFT